MDTGATVELRLDPLVELKSRGVRVAVRIGVARAAKPVRAAYQSQAEAIARYGFLGKSVGSRQQAYQGGLVSVVVIGPRRSYTRTKGSYTRGKRAGEKRRFVPARYARLADKGTSRSRGRHFASNALAATQEQYKANVAAEIAAEVAKVLPREG